MYGHETIGGYEKKAVYGWDKITVAKEVRVLETLSINVKVLCQKMSSERCVR